MLERCVATFHMEPGAKGIKYFEFVRALSEACECGPPTHTNIASVFEPAIKYILVVHHL